VKRPSEKRAILAFFARHKYKMPNLFQKDISENGAAYGGEAEILDNDDEDDREVLEWAWNEAKFLKSECELHFEILVQDLIEYPKEHWEKVRKFVHLTVPTIGEQILILAYDAFTSPFVPFGNSSFVIVFDFVS
jgi:hypothetical protein